MLLFWTSIVGIALVVALADSLARYARAGRSAARELSAEDRRLCGYVIANGLGRPWICRRAVDRGRCSCLPCRLLEEARDGSLFAAPRGGISFPYLKP
jgi:hypothetical protein